MMAFLLATADSVIIFLIHPISSQRYFLHEAFKPVNVFTEDLSPQNRQKRYHAGAFGLEAIDLYDNFYVKNVWKANSTVYTV